MSEFKLGTHEAQITAVREDVAEMKQQMREQSEAIAEIRAFVDQVRGGWKASAIILTTFGAVLGSLAAIILNVAETILGKR